MKKKIVGIVIVFILFICVIVINKQRNFTIKSVDYIGDNLKISINGNISSTLPDSGSYYLVSYDCESDETKLSWDKNNHELKVSNGNKKSDISCYLDFQTNPLLYYMEDGSYVKYRKTDNCSDDDASCRWYNANYVSDTDVGNCGGFFTTNGWRIAYKENGSAYLISAGAPECMCTGSDGSYSNSACSGNDSTTGAVNHLKNLNNHALEYCRTEYIKGGVCNGSTVWAMNADDFKKITGTDLYFNSSSDNSCVGAEADMNCGYNNDLIDNGSYYWIATSYKSSSSVDAFFWYSDYRLMSPSNSNGVYGVRPVIYLDSSVVVTGGSGTYEDPYTIGNNTFTINEASVVGDSRNITLNLVALDTVTKMCVNVGSSSCSNYVDFPVSNIYNVDLSDYGTGEKTIYVYYKDANGKVVASMQKNITLS